MMMNRKCNLLVVFAILVGQFLQGQFTITNSLKSNDTNGLVIGDQAYLTAARGIDQNGQGFMRLTNATTNQKGYFYVAPSFPSLLGVVADFEYKAWRNVADNTYFGADGFAVFLFDGAVLPANFKLGGYGGSLGYATYNSPANTTGLSGGYVGIGFDEFGNYANPSEGRNGGIGEAPNAVVLRGPTTPVFSNSNVYLTSKLLGTRSGTVNAIRARDEIDYNTTTSTRPSDDLFYRRVQIEIVRSGGNYIIKVRWKKQNELLYTELINYTMSGTTYPLPATLKLGFAASTGGGFNFHEIRNILLTTPGNLRVDSRVDQSFVCNNEGKEITLQMDVTNDTSVALSNINFLSRIQDVNGTLLTNGQFSITNISTVGFASSALPTTSATNEVSGVVSLGANQVGTVKIKGIYKANSLKSNANFYNVASVNTTQITDIDPTNNTTTLDIAVRKCGLISNPSLPSYTK